MVRASAYSALAQIGGKRSAATIRAGLKDRDPIVRRYAAVALFDLLGCDAAPTIDEALVSERDDLALSGFYHVLAFCGNREAEEGLKKLSKDEFPSVSSPARSSLVELAELRRNQGNPGG